VKDLHKFKINPRLKTQQLTPCSLASTCILAATFFKLIILPPEKKIATNAEALMAIAF